MPKSSKNESDKIKELEVTMEEFFFFFLIGIRSMQG